MYNKRKFNKINDKKVLHKVKKQWVTISLSLFMMIGGGALATHVSANADSTNNNNVALQLGSSHKAKPSITNQAKLLHNHLINNATKQNVKRNSNKPLVNNNITNRIHNVNRLKINQSGEYNQRIYSRIRTPFNVIKINHPVYLHSSVDFDNSHHIGTLPKGQLIKVNRAFKEFGYYNNYLRYEIRLADRRNAFITGNKDFVSYVVPNHNYKYYQQHISNLLKSTNSKNNTKLIKRFNKLNKQRKHSLNKYIGLYEVAYNTQRNTKHPIVVNYHNKIAKINNNNKEINRRKGMLKHRQSDKQNTNSLANSLESNATTVSSSSAIVQSIAPSSVSSDNASMNVVPVAPISFNVPSYTPVAPSSSVVPVSSASSSSVSNSTESQSTNVVPSSSVESSSAISSASSKVDSNSSKASDASSNNSTASTKSSSTSKASSSSASAKQSSAIKPRSTSSRASVAPNSMSSTSVIPNSKSSISSSSVSVQSNSASSTANNKSASISSNTNSSMSSSAESKVTSSSIAPSSKSKSVTPSKASTGSSSSNVNSNKSASAQANTSDSSSDNNSDVSSYEPALKANQMYLGSDFSYYNDKTMKNIFNCINGESDSTDNWDYSYFGNPSSSDNVIHSFMMNGHKFDRPVVNINNRIKIGKLNFYQVSLPNNESMINNLYASSSDDDYPSELIFKDVTGGHSDTTKLNLNNIWVVSDGFNTIDEYDIYSYIIPEMMLHGINNKLHSTLTEDIKPLISKVALNNKSGEERVPEVNEYAHILSDKESKEDYELGKVSDVLNKCSKYISDSDSGSDYNKHNPYITELNELDNEYDKLSDSDDSEFKKCGTQMDSSSQYYSDKLNSENPKLSDSSYMKDSDHDSLSSDVSDLNYPSAQLMSFPVLASRPDKNSQGGYEVANNKYIYPNPDINSYNSVDRTIKAEQKGMNSRPIFMKSNEYDPSDSQTLGDYLNNWRNKWTILYNYSKIVPDTQEARIRISKEFIPIEQELYNRTAQLLKKAIQFLQSLKSAAQHAPTNNPDNTNNGNKPSNKSNNSSKKNSNKVTYSDIINHSKPMSGGQTLNFSLPGKGISNIFNNILGLLTSSDRNFSNSKRRYMSGSNAQWFSNKVSNKELPPKTNVAKALDGWSVNKDSENTNSRELLIMSGSDVISGMKETISDIKNASTGDIAAIFKAPADAFIIKNIHKIVKNDLFGTKALSEYGGIVKAISNPTGFLKSVSINHIDKEVNNLEPKIYYVIPLGKPAEVDPSDNIITDH